MNNKRLGNDFEKDICDLLNCFGWWVHFINPSKTGSQPFDVIAVKKGEALAIDCKTSIKPIFSIKRLEDNQVYAFEKWLDCGNQMPYISVKYNDRIYMLQYKELKDNEKIDLRNRNPVTSTWFL